MALCLLRVYFYPTCLLDLWVTKVVLFLLAKHPRVCSPQCTLKFNLMWYLMSLHAFLSVWVLIFHVCTGFYLHGLTVCACVSWSRQRVCDSLCSGRGGPPPAGTGDPVPSEYWCEFHLSGHSVKVPVMLGKHNAQHQNIPSFLFHRHTQTHAHLIRCSTCMLILIFVKGAPTFLTK